MPDSPPFSVFVDTEREQLIGQMAYLLPCIEPHLPRAVGSCSKRAVCLIIVETSLVNESDESHSQYSHSQSRPTCR